MQESHIDRLRAHAGGWSGKRVLDLGSGRGEILIELTKQGVDATGLEYNPKYIEIARHEAETQGVSIQLVQGRAEELPFEDRSFGFANVSEVIEHVESPEAMLQELARVLTPGSYVYMSAPNRFSFLDPHYSLYGVNWLPRPWADSYVAFFKKDKDPDGAAGAQSLSEMHYYTYGNLRRVLAMHGFSVEDIREVRINDEHTGLVRYIAHTAYLFLRPWYYDSFHVRLRKI